MKHILVYSILVLMPFPSFCQNEIWNSRIFRATSSDGINWVKDTTPLLDSVSDPGVIKNENNNILLYHTYFPDSLTGDTLMIASSADGKSFSTQHAVNICCSSTTRRSDPDLVLVPGGGIRMYYVNRDDSIPKDIYSAYSIDSASFAEQSGIRFSKKNISDPDVFIVDTTWIMFTTVGTTLLRATSFNGIHFTEDTSFFWNKGGMSSTLRFPGNIYRTYFCENGVIKSAISTDGYKLSNESGIRLQSNANEVISKPSVIGLGANSYVMYYKSLALTTGTPENENNTSVTVYPNPFNEKTILHVQNTNARNLNVYIYDIDGRKVRTLKNYSSKSDFVFERNGLTSGVYFYSIVGDGKVLKSEKLIVK